jgi:hypothetical protein
MQSSLVARQKRLAILEAENSKHDAAQKAAIKENLELEAAEFRKTAITHLKPAPGRRLDFGETRTILYQFYKVKQDDPTKFDTDIIVSYAMPIIITMWSYF